MKKNETDERREKRPWGVRVLFFPGRVFNTALLLFLILYATLLGASRLEGFKALVERRLEQSFPLTWTIESARVSPALRLHLNGVRGTDETGSDVFQAAHVRFEPDRNALFRGRIEPAGLTLSDVSATFKEPGNTEPANAWAAWALRIYPGGKNVPSPFPSLDTHPAARWPWPVYRIRLQHANIDWENDEGRPVATARDLSLQVTPLAALNQRFTHLRLTASEWSAGPESVARDFSTEWLAHAALRWILNQKSAFRKWDREPPDAVGNR